MTAPPPPDVPQLTSAEITLADTLAIVFNAVSMICCAAVVVTYVYLSRRYKHLLNRISLRLTVAAVIASFFFSLAQILIALPTGPSALCTGSTWAYIFFDLLSSWLVTMIAFNMHLVFVKGRTVPAGFEKWYYWSSLILSSVAFIPLFFNGYGWEETELTCWYIKEVGQEGALLWEFGTYYAWTMIMTAYCGLAIIFVLHKIKRNSDELAEHSVTWMRRSRRSLPKRNYDDNLSLNPVPKPPEISHATIVVRKTIWYPIVIMFCNLINMVADIYLSVEGTILYFPIYLLSYVGISSEGFILCFVFCFDPALGEIWRMKKMELIQRYHPEFGYTDNDRSFLSSGQDGKKAPDQVSQLNPNRDISYLPTHKEETDRPSTRWDAVLSKLVMWTMVDKRRKNLATTNSQPYSRPSEMAEQRKRASGSGSGQRNSDIKSPTTSINIESLSPKYTNRSLEYQMSASANGPVIELVSIEKPAPTVVIDSNEPIDHRNSQIALVSSTYDRRTSNSSSTTGDSESICELEPAAHGSSFLRQPVRRGTNYSPNNSIEGNATGSASRPTSPQPVMTGRNLEISDAVCDL